MNDQLWHRNMQADLVVAGMAERTQQAYLRAVRQLSQYYSGTSPQELSEEQVKDYLHWLRIEKRAAPGTLKIASGGFRFFFRQTCGRVARPEPQTLTPECQRDRLTATNSFDS